MGDRANCVVKQYNGEVFLYTHWGGYNLLGTVQTALRRELRWNDASYLARIIFDAMTAGQQGEETGYGISTSPPDNEHLYIVVDCEKQQVMLESPDNRHPMKTWGFKEFCADDMGKYNTIKYRHSPIIGAEPLDEDE